MKHLILAPAIMVGLSACAPVTPLPAAVDRPPTHEALYTPAQVIPGRLEYAPDHATFAPILTERTAYPTQVEANDAYRRLLISTPADAPPAASIRLFGCKPGAIDQQTAQVVRFRGHVVHCATDFFDTAGRSLGRATANFAYDGSAWAMRPVFPPRTPVPWLDREASPTDSWSWLPWRDRYE